MNRKIAFQLSTVAAVIALCVGAWRVTREKMSANDGLFSNKETNVQREDGARIEKVNIEMAKRETGQPMDAGMTSKTPDGKPIMAPPSYGNLKPIDPSVSPQAKAAAEAFATKSHPERLSCAVFPAKFNVEKWKNDADYKTAYLATPEPARCYQSAQPSKETPRIALACPQLIQTMQGQPVELRVKGSPGFPVTFTSFDAASFISGSGNTGSQLTTQTSICDENGIATATLLAPPGVIDDCRVIASCPVNAGLAKITVHVRLPASAQSAASAAPPAAASVPVSTPNS